MFDISQFARAIAELFSFINKRTDLKNAADVKQAAKAQEQVKEHERITKSVADGDIDSDRRDLA